MLGSPFLGKGNDSFILGGKLRRRSHRAGGLRTERRTKWRTSPAESSGSHTVASSTSAEGSDLVEEDPVVSWSKPSRVRPNRVKATWPSTAAVQWTVNEQPVLHWTMETTPDASQTAQQRCCFGHLLIRK